MIKLSYAGCPRLGYLYYFWRNSLLRCSPQPKIAKKNFKTFYFWGLRRSLKSSMLTPLKNLSLVLFTSVPICNSFHAKRTIAVK